MQVQIPSTKGKMIFPTAFRVMLATMIKDKAGQNEYGECSTLSNWS